MGRPRGCTVGSASSRVRERTWSALAQVARACRHSGVVQFQSHRLLASASRISTGPVAVCTRNRALAAGGDAQGNESINSGAVCNQTPVPTPQRAARTSQSSGQGQRANMPSRFMGTPPPGLLLPRWVGRQDYLPLPALNPQRPSPVHRAGVHVPGSKCLQD